ncbi:MAG: SH3 domain-containing protein [Anaerolineae bacterium]
MATQPEKQSMTPEPQRDGGEGDSAIGAGTLATVGLGLIALAILIYFLWPWITGISQPTSEKTPATVIAELVTATPIRPTPTAVPTSTVSEAGIPTPAPPSPTSIPPTATVPVKVQAAAYAKVAGTGTGGLRFRSGPGLDFITWRILPEGEILKVTGGPEEADGAIWWRALDKTGLIGWAAEQYLVPVEPPAWTPEPERTPDVTELTPTPES